MMTRTLTRGVLFGSVCALILAGGLLAGCTTEKAAYEAAVAEGTPDALRMFLEEYPDGMYAASARPELDELDWKEAAEANTSDAYEQYVVNHPEGIHAQDAAIAAPKAAWREMDLSNDKASIDAFLEKYGNSAYAVQAKERLALIETAETNLTVGELAVAPSESGGWTISAPVQNIGSDDLVEVAFRIAFLDEGGKVLAETEISLVETPPADASDRDERYEPLCPGKSRALQYDLAPQRAPERWGGAAEHVRLVLSKLTVAV